MQNFRLFHFQDIKVPRVAEVAKFQTLSSSGYHIKVAKVGRVTKFQSYHFQDIKVARVAEVANFQTLSISGYQGCEGCKISDFIIFRMSRLRGLQRLQIFRLCQFQDIKCARVAKFQTLSSSRYHIKVARVGKVTKFQTYHLHDIMVARVAEVAKFQTLSFSGY